MGVMACDRKDCENIMCDRYADNIGYICNECYEELSKILPMDVEFFMKTSKVPKKKIAKDEEDLDKMFHKCSH